MDKTALRVLLVEDDPDDHLLTSELLAEIPGRPITLDWVQDYDSGLAALQRDEHDAILLDYRLGKADGLALLRAGFQEGRRAPVILLTGQGDRDLALQALEAGAADYLVKGELNAVVLERAIRYAMEKNRHALELERQVAARTAQLQKAITAQRESEDYLRLMLDSTEQPFYGIDQAGHTTICNTAFVRLLGFATVEEVIGQRLHDLIHHTRPDGSHYPVEACPIYVTAQTGKAMHVEDELFYPQEGDPISMEYWSYPVYRNGELRGAITTFIDIRERKKAEAAAAEAAERFRFLAESMPQKIFTATPTGEVDYFNREWMEFTGLSYEQIRDWGWLQFIHPEDVEENIRRWKHSIATLEPFSIEHRFLRIDGHYRWHLSRAFPMRDGEGKVTMWIGSNTDIDDQKRHEQELRESEARAHALAKAAESARVSAEAAKSRAEAATRAKDDFLAALSHELRTPLNPALLLATSLAEDPDLPPRVRKDIDVISKGIALQAELVDDLLDITRITGGKLRLELRPIDAHVVLHNAYEIVRTDAEERELEITFHLAAAHNCIRGDAVRLQQIFWNVLKNAVKFTAPGGRIRVQTSNPKDNANILLVEVIDTGIGIEPDMLRTVFDAFMQEEHDRAHRFGGIGLGLAITRRLVELQNGRIEALSRGRGEGATFGSSFPWKRPSSAKRPRRHRSCARTRGPVRETFCWWRITSKLA